MGSEIISVYTKHEESNKLDFIDALRGFAALNIIIFHMVGIPQLIVGHPVLEIPQPLNKFFPYLGYNVMLFFIISAFTLYLSMDNRNNEEKRIVNFYIRRFFRIAPLFYLMLIYMIVISKIYYNYVPPTNQILLNIIFAFNFFPSYAESIVPAGWAIGVEMLFYLLFPLLFLKINNLHRAIAFFVFTISFSLIFKLLISQGIIFSSHITSQYLYINFISQLPIFSIGIICYYIYQYISSNVKFTEKMLRYALYIFLMSLYSLNFFHIIGLTPDSLIPLHYWEALAFGSLLLSLALYPNKLFVNKITKFYGKISYSTYLVHPILISYLIPTYEYIYRYESIHTVFLFCFCIILTLTLLSPLAMLTYYLVERPCLKYGMHLLYR